ncbi:hypothetical protein ACTWPT_19885 [Nonomuraea sp. 3N208]|uniref:hypothetical protein n=1 Tax=Nonomuraea sp. 3N208 TaxID=3457421 RepID=UPI003FCD6483
MISRILAGAAIAAVALGFTASSASADQPNANNSGQAVLSQFQIFDDVLSGWANGSLNNSLRNIEVSLVKYLYVEEVDLDLLNNQAAVTPRF